MTKKVEEDKLKCNYSANLPELFWKLNSTIVISTYQWGKLFFIYCSTPNKLTLLSRHFQRPMGVAINNRLLAIAIKRNVLIYGMSLSLAKNYPLYPNNYNAIFIQRASYNCGELDLHDLVWSKYGLMAVNTNFSCLSIIDHEYNFKPFWKPEFISEYRPEDRCHLNGLTLNKNYEPEFVTAFGMTNSPEGWRKKKLENGVLINIKSNEIILENLPMPHSPRMYDYNDFYLLLSATGEVIKVNLDKKNYEVLTTINGFVRGLVKLNDFLFIGVSKIRDSNQGMFKNLPITDKANFCGIKILHLPTKTIIGEIEFINSAAEIYDVHVIQNLSKIGITNYNDEINFKALNTPFGDFWKKDNLY